MKTGIETTHKGFDRLAGIYDRLAWLIFGNTLLKAQWKFLHKIEHNSRVLVIGGGTGKGILPLLRDKTHLSLTYLEHSSIMLDHAKQHLSPFQFTRDHQLDFLLGTEKILKSHEKYDVIITAFFLDLFNPEELDQVFQQLDDVLDRGGKWIFTDFDIPKGWFHIPGRILIWGMYRFFRFSCGISARKLPHFNHYFKSFRYRTLAETSYYHELICTRVFLKPLS